MSEWIKCSDRLPKIEEWRSTFIVYGSPKCGSHCNDFQVMEAYYRREDKCWEFGEYDCPINVTHWMPLPKPPEE